eukprot:Transcript_32388.p1 GENE.Transcript_32388~~Transcript_32388.p1  ORF type:complete len:365 (+),score=129.85 Transcript_32388:150-1244(+)
MLSSLAALHLAWSELSLRHGHAVPGATSAAAATALANGESVLLVPDVASSAECDAIVQACLPALDDGQSLIRLPSIAAAELAAAAGEQDAFAGDPGADASLCRLPAEADSICTAILRRVFATIDEQLPHVAVSQFGTARLSELVAAGELEFAAREPAVNVYSAGGNFPPHEDHQGLTVLVPLSDHGGGGTGFWVGEREEEEEEEDEDEPSAAVATVEEMEAEDEDDAAVNEHAAATGFGAADEVYAEGWYDGVLEDEAEAELEDDWFMEELEGAEAEAARNAAEAWARVSAGPPPTVLRPVAGTAMLFSGEVLHAATPVHHGARVVLVASFSGVRVWPDPWHRPIGAATYTVLRAAGEATGASE